MVGESRGSDLDQKFMWVADGAKEKNVINKFDVI